MSLLIFNYFSQNGAGKHPELWESQKPKLTEIESEVPGQ